MMRALVTRVPAREAERHPEQTDRGQDHRRPPGPAPEPAEPHLPRALAVPADVADWKAVEKAAAKIVVIDSLNGYLNAMPDENYLTAQLHEMLSYLNNRGVATFLAFQTWVILAGGDGVSIPLLWLARTFLWTAAALASGDLAPGR